MSAVSCSVSCKFVFRNFALIAPGRHLIHKGTEVDSDRLLESVQLINERKRKENEKEKKREKEQWIGYSLVGGESTQKTGEMPLYNVICYGKLRRRNNHTYIAGQKEE